LLAINPVTISVNATGGEGWSGNYRADFPHVPCAFN
jgi:hypothetical protein